MKTISTFITEKLKVSSNVKHGDCTLEEFLEWYYFGYEKSIDDLTFDELQRTFGEVFDGLTQNEKDLLERYYVIPERKWYGNTRVEKLFKAVPEMA